MVEEKSLKFIVFYLFIPMTLYFILKDTINLNFFYLFPLIVIFSRKFLIKFSNHFKKLFLFFSLFLLYQSLYPISFDQSLNSIQIILLSQNKLVILSISLLILFLLFYFFQDKIQAAFVHSNYIMSHPVKVFKTKKEGYLDLYSESRTKLNRRNIHSIIKDIPRHGYINYTNRYSLSKEYFKLSKESIQKEKYLYLILSETGSPASEILSLFTHKNYNHISLSFDRSLYTMVSYNGGNGHQNPGLNHELLTNLNQKENSQVLVYRLKMDKEDRFKILNKIKRINREGSAYNVVGLITSVNIRRNMMYCSEFVYRMLEEIDLELFEVKEDKIKPTDFIDYNINEALVFDYEIDFSKINQEIVS